MLVPRKEWCEDLTLMTIMKSYNAAIKQNYVTQTVDYLLEESSFAGYDDI